MRQTVQKMIEEKSKQMSVLIVSIGEIEDSQIQRQKEISKLDAEVEMLNIKKSEIVQECEAANKEMKKLEKKMKKLEDFQQLLRFIERQIEDVEKELECPVCLETAVQAPIFKCEEDHLICSKCREKVSCCPVCRMEYPRGARKRLRGAERQAERLAGMYNERESLLRSQ